MNRCVCGGICYRDCNTITFVFVALSRCEFISVSSGLYKSDLQLRQWNEIARCQISSRYRGCFIDSRSFLSRGHAQIASLLMMKTFEHVARELYEHERPFKRLEKKRTGHFRENVAIAHESRSYKSQKSPVTYLEQISTFQRVFADRPNV